MPSFAPDEPIMRKHRFSSFYGTALNEYMRRRGRHPDHRRGLDRQLHDHDRGRRSQPGLQGDRARDTCAAIPASLDDHLGYGQHWEALRNIQANHGDLLVAQLLEMLNADPASA